MLTINFIKTLCMLKKFYFSKTASAEPSAVVRINQDDISEMARLTFCAEFDVNLCLFA